MIRFDNVSVTYTGAGVPVLSEVNLHVEEGELCLVVGPTGTGKTTLLGAVNGLVPHFSGGTLSGRVTVAGRDTATNPPRELADVVGYVSQDPQSGFVTDTVEEELAYGMECLGLAPDTMRRRVEETLDLLGIADLRDRPLRSLSGGQRQRVAIASVMTAQPRILVLDEPTSALDPGASDEVLAALQRLVHDLGVTVLLAEHRLERVIQYADRVVLLPGLGQPIRVGSPAAIMRDAPVAPPVVELGRLAGWSPLPMSIRDARRVAGPLRETLSILGTGYDGRVHRRPAPPLGSRATAQRPTLEIVNTSVSYGDLIAIDEVTFAAAPGEVVALMGRNGAGKSSLLGAAVGLITPRTGSVRVDGQNPAALRGLPLVSRVGFVPQQPTDLLCADRVVDECTSSDKDAAAAAGTTADLLLELAGPIDALSHPRDLSEGQRLALVLAIVLAARPTLLLLDEPTRGLDYSAKTRLVATLKALATQGHAIVLATHDVELVAEVATRVVVLADGQIVADGPTEDVIVSSPIFAPQVAKILAPISTCLTVREVAEAIA